MACRAAAEAAATEEGDPVNADGTDSSRHVVPARLARFPSRSTRVWRSEVRRTGEDRHCKRGRHGIRIIHKPCQYFQPPLLTSNAGLPPT